jgi:hypothetical protein
MEPRNRFEHAHRGRARAALVGLAICAALAATGALAAPYTYTFHYVTLSGSGQASGTAVFDDSLLAPNTDLNFTCDLSQLTSFNLTITGLATSPSSTSFTKADLNAWQLATDSSGRLTDLNFFMRDSACGPNKVNADDYAIDGVNNFTIDLYQDNNGSAIAEFAGNNMVIPTLSTCGAIAFALLILVAGALLVARRFV